MVFFLLKNKCRKTDSFPLRRLFFLCIWNGHLEFSSVPFRSVLYLSLKGTLVGQVIFICCTFWITWCHSVENPTEGAGIQIYTEIFLYTQLYIAYIYIYNIYLYIYIKGAYSPLGLCRLCGRHLKDNLHRESR